VYAGTPDFAVPALAALLDEGYTVPCVYTQPDRPAGRGRKVQMSPVKQLALEHGLEIQQPQSLRDPEQLDEQLIQLQSYDCHLMVVAAYGQILPAEILQIPTYGCINIHASLLPRWRGAAPIHRAIEAGDKKTGISIMQMDKGLDTGDVLHTVETAIGVNTTTSELHDQLAALGAEALMHTMESLHANSLTPKPQDEALANYANKITKNESVVDWSLPAIEIHKKVCAFNPWPVAQTMIADEVIRIWETSVVDKPTQSETGKTNNGQIVRASVYLDVCTGDGVLRIHRVQPSGKKAMSVRDFLNSRRVEVGTSLG